MLLYIAFNKCKSLKNLTILPEIRACTKKKIKIYYMSPGENVNKVFECDIQGNCLAQFYTVLLSPTAKIAVIKLSRTIQYEVLDMELRRCLPRR